MQHKFAEGQLFQSINRILGFEDSVFYSTRKKLNLNNPSLIVKSNVPIRKNLSHYNDLNENKFSSSSFNNDNCVDNKKQEQHATKINLEQSHAQQSPNLYKLDTKLYDLNENSEHSLTETNKKRFIVKSNNRRVSKSTTIDGTTIKLKSISQSKLDSSNEQTLSINPSIILSEPMTQYTKFTKNLPYNENYSNQVANGGSINTPLNHPLAKTSSRGSNMTGLSANGSPSLTLTNTNLPKPVLITNLNSSNISSLIKNERIKSSTIARSVTMRYNTNTKIQFDPSNYTNGTPNLGGNSNGTPNQSIQTNHFHYNRRSLQQQQQSPTQQQHQLQLQHQSSINQVQQQPSLSIQQPSQLSVDSSNTASKKEYLSLLSNIHRSQSIKMNRDKTNLSGYFSGLVSQRDKMQAAAAAGATANTNGSSNLNGGSSNLANLSSNSNSISNNNSTTNFIQLNNKYTRKHQPFSLRNNNSINNSINNNNNNNISNNNNNSLYNTNNNASNNSINLTGSTDGNYLLTNNSVTLNSNGLMLNSKPITTSNNRLSEISKISNSISLDNVYNGLDLIIANEHKYNHARLDLVANKSNNNLGGMSFTSTLNSKKSNPNQLATHHPHQTQTSTNSINFNYSNSNYLIDNSNRVINELNLLKNKKRAQKLEIDDELTQNSTNLLNSNNNNINNNISEENMLTKDLSSSRSNHLKLNDNLNENEENTVNSNNVINNLIDEVEHNYHKNHNGNNENGLLKAANYFSKKVKPSKSELRHSKLTDDVVYNNKINKLDLIDQLDIYHKPSNSLSYLKGTMKPLLNATPSANPQNHSAAHSPVNNCRFKPELQQQRTLLEYNANKNMGSTNMLDSQSKLNQSRSQLTRNHSRLSHVTRDVNDSYAYTNVQQYIEENDLMPPEKAHSIKKWIMEVNNNFEEWEKKTVEKHIEDSFI